MRRGQSSFRPLAYLKLPEEQDRALAISREMRSVSGTIAARKACSRSAFYASANRCPFTVEDSARYSPSSSCSGRAGVNLRRRLKKLVS